MPLVRIDLDASTRQSTQRAIADGVHDALVQAIGIPPGDRFQILTPHRSEELIFDAGYLGVERRDVVYIQITLRGGRSQEQKNDLYARIVANLAAGGVAAEDVFVTLTENGSGDWSLGRGEAQLLDR
jgi:4-oxalocrotonate tautomerase